MINPKIFSSFFSASEVLPVLNAELFVSGGYKEANVVALQDNKKHSTFVDKNKEALLAEKGMEIFSDKERYKQYVESFRKNMEEVEENIFKYLEASKSIDKETAIRIMDTLRETFVGYAFTEYHFHDKAFLEKEKSEVLIKNLEHLSKFKIEARKVLNKVIFKGGIIRKFLSIIQDQFEVETYYLTRKEILDLYDGIMPEGDIVEKRKQGYIAAATEKGIIIDGGNKYKEMLADMSTIEKNDFVKGLIASKGSAKGKVVVAPMFYDPEKVSKVISKMNEGDVLVAHTTSPEIMMLCEKASAIVTDQGGMLSHAAVVSRELGIPCIVGTLNATKIFKDGDFVVVNAYDGIVKKAETD